jgi:hypothetical protein
MGCEQVRFGRVERNQFVSHFAETILIPRVARSILVNNL